MIQPDSGLQAISRQSIEHQAVMQNWMPTDESMSRSWCTRCLGYAALSADWICSPSLMMFLRFETILAIARRL